MDTVAKQTDEPVPSDSTATEDLPELVVAAVKLLPGMLRRLGLDDAASECDKIASSAMFCGLDVSSRGDDP